MLQQEKTNHIISVIALVLSAFFSYLIVSFGYFPYLGFALSFIILATLVFCLKTNKNNSAKTIYTAILLLSVFLVLRANMFLTFLNVVAILYLGSFLVLGLNKQTGLTDLILAPLKVFYWSLLVKNDYPFPLSKHGREKNTISNQKNNQLLLSIVITGVILMVIIPLLSYANPLFRQLIINLVQRLDVVAWIQRLLGKNDILLITRTAFFLGFAFFIPRLLSLSNQKKETHFRLKPIVLPNLMIPKISVAIILTVFFITQIELYFATDQTLRALGYSHSRQTREVFAQLSIVALIIFGLIYHDRKTSGSGRFMTDFLIVQAIFLNLIGLKSDYDYCAAWGFTQKRLYGFAVVTWMLGLFGLFWYHFQKTKKVVLGRSLVWLTTIILIAINFANFDYLIYHYAKSRTGEGVDYPYLSRLSADGRYYADSLQTLSAKITAAGEPDPRDIFAARRIYSHAAQLAEKYRGLDWRGFNLAEYRQFRTIRELPLDHYYQLFFATHKSVNPTEVRDGPFSSRVVELKTLPTPTPNQVILTIPAGKNPSFALPTPTASFKSSNL